MLGRGTSARLWRIVARYQATVSGVALGILNDFEASEDAAQEVFLSAWKKIDSIKEPPKVARLVGDDCAVEGL